MPKLPERYKIPDGPKEVKARAEAERADVERTEMKKRAHNYESAILHLFAGKDMSGKTQIPVTIVDIVGTFHIVFPEYIDKADMVLSVFKEMYEERKRIENTVEEYTKLRPLTEGME